MPEVNVGRQASGVRRQAPVGTSALQAQPGVMT